MGPQRLATSVEVRVGIPTKTEECYVRYVELSLLVKCGKSIQKQARVLLEGNKLLGRAECEAGLGRATLESPWQLASWS